MPDTAVTEKRLGVIARIIDVCARRRLFVFGITIALTIWGVVSARRAQLDALPDLSDTQVIVATEWMGRNPKLIEDQVTYPITTTFLGAPKVKTVRGFTMFGMSLVYVVFEDGTDLYWARSRVVGYLARVRDKLPAGVNPQIGPDATVPTVPEFVEHALEAASNRVRPLLMTVLANVFGLLPILFDDGVGVDLAKRIALPMWGGLVSLTVLTLFVIPAVYVVWRSFHLRRNTGSRVGRLANGGH